MESIAQGTPSPEELYLSGLGWERPDPDRILPTYARNHFRIHYITAGSGHLKTPGQDLFVSEGMGFLIFPGTIPNYYPERNNPWEYIWMGIQGEIVQKLVENTGIAPHSPAFQSIRPPEEMRMLMTDICLAAMMPEAAENVLQYYLQDLFQKIVPLRNDAIKRSRYIQTCLDFIHENYAKPITVADISRHAAIERTYLYKIFMSNIGVSPQNYLINYRISQACKLLRSTNKSVTEIAFQTGFKDFSDFSRQFKKRQQMTPTLFRVLGSSDNLTAPNVDAT